MYPNLGKSHCEGWHRDTGTPEIGLTAAPASWAETQLEESEEPAGTRRGRCWIQRSSHFFSSSFSSLKFFFNFLF